MDRSKDKGKRRGRGHKSRRVASGALDRRRPFYSFPLDVEVSRKLVSDFHNQVHKSLKDLASSDHLTMIGRPLWRGYRHLVCRDLRQFVTEKLFGTIYDPTNQAKGVGKPEPPPGGTSRGADDLRELD